MTKIWAVPSRSFIYWTIMMYCDGLFRFPMIHLNTIFIKKILRKFLSVKRSVYVCVFTTFKYFFHALNKL